MELARPEEEERVDLAGYRFRTCVVATERLRRVREPVVSTSYAHGVAPPAEGRAERFHKVEMLNGGHEAQALWELRPGHHPGELLGVATGLSHLHEEGRTRDRDVRDRCMAQDHRQVSAGSFVAGRKVAGPEAGSGREVDWNPGRLPDFGGEFVGVTHQTGRDLEDDPPRFLLTDRFEERGSDVREHPRDRVGCRRLESATGHRPKTGGRR